MEGLGIEPYIATGREAHHQDLSVVLGKLPEAPAPDACPKEKMAYKLATEIGRAIYRLRKCTVEPVIGIIKEIMGFRQFSLRSLKKVTGEWCLVCLAFRLRRQTHACLDDRIGCFFTRLLLANSMGLKSGE